MTVAEQQTAAPGPRRPLHDVGVLLVHGIGQQRRAETLVGFGEPLVRWIQAWLAGASNPVLGRGLTRGEVDAWVDRIEPRWNHTGGMGRTARAIQVAHTLRMRARQGPAPETKPVLGDSDRIVAGGVSLADAALHLEDGSSDPAHLTLHVTALQENGEARHASWLAAESWWAHAFEAPRFTSLAAWALDIVPCTIASHFGSQIRRAWSRPRTDPLRHVARVADTAFAVASYLVGVVFGMLVGALMLVLSPLAAIPIPQVQSLLKGIHQGLASTLGDSYVLVVSPLQAASIVGQVRHDVAWLSERCERVLVVAHSQGAAAAFEALRQGAPENVANLITFGSGLRKLEELRLSLGGRQASRVAGLIAFSGMTLVLAPLLFPRLFAPAGPWLMVLGGVVLVVGILMSLARFDLDGVRLWGERFCPKRFLWEDYYADADPISNGPLFDAEEDVGFVMSSEVSNRGSVVQDHNAYWTNREQFVSRIAHAASMNTPVPLAMLTRDDAKLMGVARRRRHWRVRMLHASRWIVAIAAAVLAVFNADVTLPLMRRGASLLAPVVGMAETFSWFASRVPSSTAAMDLWWCRALVLLVAYVLFTLIIERLWLLWDWREGDRLTRREPVQGVQWLTGIFIVATVLVVELFVLLAILGVDRLRGLVLMSWVTIAATALGAVVLAYALTRVWWRRLEHMTQSVDPPRAQKQQMSPAGSTSERGAARA